MATQNTQKKENAISEELALNELEIFINKFVKKPEEKDKLKDSYPSILEAICMGNLVFDENGIPKYKLMHPVLNSENEVSLSEINFKTRVKPTTKADLADGLDLQKQAAKFSLRIIAYIIGQPINMLDKFEVEDYDAISEISAVFMAGGR